MPNAADPHVEAQAPLEGPVGELDGWHAALNAVWGMDDDLAAFPASREQEAFLRKVASVVPPGAWQTGNARKYLWPDGSTHVNIRASMPSALSHSRLPLDFTRARDHLAEKKRPLLLYAHYLEDGFVPKRRGAIEKRLGGFRKRRVHRALKKAMRDAPRDGEQAYIFRDLSNPLAASYSCALLFSDGFFFSTEDVVAQGGLPDADWFADWLDELAVDVPER
jgi:hypothetical protein